LCEESATAADIRKAAPRPVTESAVDPIALAPVDEMISIPVMIGCLDSGSVTLTNARTRPVMTTLVDNVYDALLAGDAAVTRARHSRSARPSLRSSNRERPRSG